MRKVTLIAVLVACAATPLWSQNVVRRGVEVAEPVGGATGGVMTWATEAAPLTDAVFLHGPGMRFEGPPKKGAPYSAEVVTETVQALADGNRIRRENRAKIYRDAEGRTRREEKLDAVGPWAVAGEQPTRIFINDPVAGVHWVLEPENKIAHKMEIPSFEANVGVPAEIAMDVTIAAPPGATSTAVFTRRIEEGRVEAVRHGAFAVASAPGEQPNVEDLGTRMMEGVEAKGSKVTRVIPAGEIGNERPIEVVFERWHSEQLGVDVLTRRSDPRSAETSYKLTNIQQTEPLPGLFEPPPDFEVKQPENQRFFQKMERVKPN